MTGHIAAELALSDEDRSQLAGEQGAAVQFAMRILVRMATVMGASELLDIESAHIDSCLYHGRSGLDFAQRLVADGGTVCVPTTLNVSSLDLLHPDLYRGDVETGRLARDLMVLYEQLGCRPTWTCAPYQQDQRPSLGTNIAWAESNAIVFANSVLGARTNRYGDFIDICAAVTGRAPAAGLHLDEHRLATVVIDVNHLEPGVLAAPDFPAVLGYWMGAQITHEIAVIDGLPPDTGEDQLKALGAAGASSGSIALFHAVGITPEAPALAAALSPRVTPTVLRPSIESLRLVRGSLSRAEPGQPLAAVSLGTPHYSVSEFAQLATLLDGRRIAGGVTMFASTGRSVLNELSLRGLDTRLEASGVQIVTDTCTYITPIIEPRPGVIMTDSAKWASYAPGNIGAEVVFATTASCVESAVNGRIIETPSAWGTSQSDDVQP